VSAALTVAFVWAARPPSIGYFVLMHLATVFTAGRVLHGRLAAVRRRARTSPCSISGLRWGACWAGW
jgi:hypothetical protein